MNARASFSRAGVLATLGLGPGPGRQYTGSSSDGTFAATVAGGHWDYVRPAVISAEKYAIIYIYVYMITWLS